MYAPLDPQRGSMEDILRSLGAVLDTRMATAIQIAQREDTLVVRALAVSGVTQRLDGCWSRVEHVLTHVDLVQLGMAQAARCRNGHVPGPHEGSLRVMGRLIDDRGLRGMTLMQHPSNGGWLLWHVMPALDTMALISMSDDEITAATTLPVPLRGNAVQGSDAGVAPKGVGLSVRPWGAIDPRDTFRFRLGRPMLTFAGAAADS